MRNVPPIDSFAPFSLCCIINVVSCLCKGFKYKLGIPMHRLRKREDWTLW
jgi:hypothetical protein